MRLVDRGERYSNQRDQLVDAQVLHIERGAGPVGYLWPASVFLVAVVLLWLPAKFWKRKAKRQDAK